MTPLGCVLLALTLSTADDAPAPRVSELTQWLAAGPLPLALPAFHAGGDEGAAAKKKGSVEPADLLKLDWIDFARLRPEEGGALAAPDGASLEWHARERFQSGSTAQPALELLFTRLDCDRQVKPTLKVSSRHPLRIFVDGAQVGQKAKADGADAAKPEEVSCEVALEPGPHRLLIASLFVPEKSEEWRVEAVLELPAGQEGASVRPTLDPLRVLDVDDVLDTDAISAVQFAPDGQFVAIQYRRPEVPADFAQRWLEIRDVESGQVVMHSEGAAEYGGFQWVGAGSDFSFVENKAGKATLWRQSPGGEPRAVLRDVDRFRDYRWRRDGRSVIYSVAEESKPDARGVKRMNGLADRLPDHREKVRLWQAGMPAAHGESGALRRELTAGPLTCTLADVRADGKKLLFTRALDDRPERPYEQTELFELDLETLEPTLLLGGRFLRDASYLAAGEKVLVIGGISLTTAAPEHEGDAIPNDYDAEAWRLDVATRAAECLTRDFAPNVQAAEYCEADGRLYVRAEYGLRVALFRSGSIDGALDLQRVDLPVDSAALLAVARGAARAVVVGSSPAAPPVCCSIDLASGRTQTLVRPGDETWSRIRFGKVEDWSFTTKARERIDGYVTYPPDFDAAKRYPCIVFYYGGTSPTGREFGGRYPKDLWAARGYVVYSLTPSGSTGRGPEFAARHVNNWGRTVAGEILEGVDQFLAAHRFVDPDRVGCIGASYGGFMTMLLVTESDRFKAAVAHAGISSISSYWGEGFWGYSYSAVASANSFPWNARELYVDQSPLFRADRIHTPLLLTHGEADTNVPIGESEQLYTALRLLGRDVEFLKFAGQNHHILNYPVRKLWMKSILAWFDWRLKGEKAAWDALYPEES